jgi:hypothetical protein
MSILAYLSSDVAYVSPLRFTTLLRMSYLYPGPYLRTLLVYKYDSCVLRKALELILLISPPHLVCALVRSARTLLRLFLVLFRTRLGILFRLFPVTYQSRFRPTRDGLGSQPTSRTRPLRPTLRHVRTPLGVRS